MEKRLDRVLATVTWLDTYPNATIRNEIWDVSDHLPMLIDLVRSSPPGSRVMGPRLFQFETKWPHEMNFEDI